MTLYRIEQLGELAPLGQFKSGTDAYFWIARNIEPPRGVKGWSQLPEWSGHELFTTTFNARQGRPVGYVLK